jgi:hypothetical protein
MARPRALTTAQEEKIRDKIRRGATVDAAHTYAKTAPPRGLGLKISRTKIGELALQGLPDRAAQIGATAKRKPKKTAKAPDNEEVLADLHRRVLQLEDLLAAPSEQPVSAREVLTQTLAAMRRHVSRPDLDPKALAVLGAQIVEVARALRDLEEADGADIPRGF